MIRSAIALSCMSVVSSPALAVNSPNYDVIYEPSDGSVWVDTNGGRMINFVLEGGPFLYENFINPLQPTITSVVGAKSHQLGVSNLNAQFMPFPVTIGNVMPAGLTENEFKAYLKVYATYVANLATPVTKFDLYYGQPTERQPAYVGSGGASGITRLAIGVQGLFDANGQPLTSSSKTMAVIDVDGDGIAGFNLDSWDGSTFLPDPDDVLVTGINQGLWHEATGDGDLFEDRAPANLTFSVLDSDEADMYEIQVVNAALNNTTTVGTGDRVYLFYFPDLSIDATEPGPLRSFGVLEAGSLSSPGEISNFFSLPINTVYLADNSTGDGVVASYATVPEPATLALIALGGLLIVHRRRA